MQKYFNLAASLVGFASLGVVLVLQYGFDMQPCPLCIFERIVVFFLSCLLFINFFIDRVYLRLFIGSLFIKGLILAGYHTHILLNPDASCAIFWSHSLLEINMAVPWLNFMLESRSLCGQGQDTFLGVLLPLWVVILLIGMAYFAYYKHLNIFKKTNEKASVETDA